MSMYIAPAVYCHVTIMFLNRLPGILLLLPIIAVYMPTILYKHMKLLRRYVYTYVCLYNSAIYVAICVYVCTCIG